MPKMKPPMPHLGVNNKNSGSKGSQKVSLNAFKGSEIFAQSDGNEGSLNQDINDLQNFTIEAIEHFRDKMRVITTN